MRRMVLVIGLAVLVGAPALADDYNPPPWRGEPGWTFAQWEFNDENMMPPPDIWDNPFGPPELEVNPFGEGWLPEYQERQGVWMLSGEIWVDIWNFPDLNPEKWIWVQLTWAPMLGEPMPFPNVEEIATPGGPHPGLEIDQRPAGPGDWMYSTFLIELEPNPEFETVHIWGDIYVDELVIDTICIPEPATLGMLAFAGLGLLRRR